MIFFKIRQGLLKNQTNNLAEETPRALMSRVCQRGVNVTKTSFLFFYFFFSHRTRQTAYHSKELFCSNITVQKYLPFSNRKKVADERKILHNEGAPTIFFKIRQGL